MRTFIALDLPHEFRCEVRQLSINLSQSIQARFLKEDTYHVTLAFIGETDEAESIRIIQALDLAAHNSPPITLQPCGLGKFGKSHNATVFLELALHDQLLDLTQKIREELLAQHIFFDKKKFKPHITIARHATLPKGPLPHILFPSPTKTESLTFYKSVLKPEGAEYKALYRVSLQNKVKQIDAT